jgi:DeoR/GlpR family transcriptional regulator of sugar metabolism
LDIVNNVCKNEITPATRKTLILNTLNETGEVRVTELSQMLNTSVVTIRKDLDKLEKEGLLKRVHGGAVKTSRTQQTLFITDNRNIKKAEKKAIAAATSELVEEGESVIINVGSTTFYVSQELKKKKNLIVITNALMIYNEFAYCRNITTFFLGGRHHVGMQITCGDDTIEQLSKYRADKLIIGMDGVDIEAGATTYNHVEDTVMRYMIECSKEKILVVDDSKIKRTTFAHVAPLTAFDTMVTNYVPHHADFYRKLEDMGLRVITV